MAVGGLGVGEGVGVAVAGLGVAVGVEVEVAVGGIAVPVGVEVAVAGIGVAVGAFAVKLPLTTVTATVLPLASTAIGTQLMAEVPTPATLYFKVKTVALPLKAGAGLSKLPVSDHKPLDCGLLSKMKLLLLVKTVPSVRVCPVNTAGLTVQSTCNPYILVALLRLSATLTVEPTKPLAGVTTTVKVVPAAAAA